MIGMLAAFAYLATASATLASALMGAEAAKALGAAIIAAAVTWLLSELENL